MIDKELLNGCTTDSERATALFFDRLGLDCVSLNTKIPTKYKTDLGEIDGVFIDHKHEFIFIYDDSTHKTDVNKKISGWFTKWTSEKNKTILIDYLNLPDHYRFIILYIDKIKNSDKYEDLEPIRSSIKSNCKVIFLDDFNYLNKLSFEIKQWSKNDLYIFLELRIKDSVLKRKKAIQFYIGNTPAFVYSDRVENILEYSYVYRRRNETDNIGYQRALDKKRIDNISKLISEGKLNSFPNSVLLNCLEEINVNLVPKEDCPSEVEIDLPSNFSSCRIVDGQHRIMSFAKTNSIIQKKYSLPIVLFKNMPQDEEIKTFIDINDNQQTIDKNLTLSLKSKLNWPKGSKEHLQKISYQIVQEISRKNINFKIRVFKGYSDESKKFGKENKLTILSIVNVLIKNKIVAKGGGIIQSNEEDYYTPSKVINDFFEQLIIVDGKNQNYYFSNRGFNLIIKFIGIIKLNLKNGIIKNGNTYEILKNEFITQLPSLIHLLKKNYGVAGEKNSLELLCFTLENKLDILIETDLRKLKLFPLPSPNLLKPRL